MVRLVAFYLHDMVVAELQGSRHFKLCFLDKELGVLSLTREFSRSISRCSRKEADRPFGLGMVSI